MNYDFNREWLVKKFQEIQRRLLKAVDQLNDEQLNWKPNNTSHSISTLIVHIAGNIQERIKKGILHNESEVIRNRDEELIHTRTHKEQLQIMIREQTQFVIDTINNMSEEQFEQKQIVRSKERLNIDMLHQCAAHYSEHMGQIFYAAKLCLGDKYNSTSI